jgi:hypothetical protein
MPSGFDLIGQPVTWKDKKSFDDCEVDLTVVYFPASKVELHCEVKSFQGQICVVAVQIGLCGKKGKKIRQLPIHRFGADGVSTSFLDPKRSIAVQAWHIAETEGIDCSVWHL